MTYGGSNMIIEHTKKEQEFLIDTESKDQLMIIGLLQQKVSDMYDIIADGDRVIVRKVPCIQLLC